MEEQHEEQRRWTDISNLHNNPCVDIHRNKVFSYPENGYDSITYTGHKWSLQD